MIAHDEGKIKFDYNDQSIFGSVGNRLRIEGILVIERKIALNLKLD